MKTVAPIDELEARRLEEICYRVRKGILTLVYNIGMGHLGGEMSMVETAVALYYRYMDFDVLDPHKPDRDRFILSKGHCSETLYTIFSDLGAYSMQYMIDNFECLDKSKFGMHTNRKYCPQVEVSAGSLGHGLPIAVGILDCVLPKLVWIDVLDIWQRKMRFDHVLTSDMGRKMMRTAFSGDTLLPVSCKNFAPAIACVTPPAAMGKTSANR